MKAVSNERGVLLNETTISSAYLQVEIAMNWECHFSVVLTYMLQTKSIIIDP